MKIHPIIWWLIALALLGGGGVAVYSKLRGIRNNNPGNIRRTGIGWRGEVPDAEKTDDEFEQFIHAKWGIRAIARELKANERRGQNTIREIISEWAPPEDGNETDELIKIAARRVGFGPDERFNISANLDPLIRAIIRQENGIQPYSDALIAEAIALS